MMRFLLAIFLTVSMVASAQSDDDDAPLPYGGDDTSDKSPARKKKSRRAIDSSDEDAREDEEEVKSLASLDDPNVGIGIDFLSGVALLGSSKFGLDPRFYLGARFTWEFGRSFSDEYLREMFFTDITWLYSKTADGTTQVNVATHLHNFTVAPAFALPFGKSFMAAYAQLGVGVDYSYSVATFDATQYTLGGAKFLFQYGIGLRGRPAVIASGKARLSFRIEVTRFVRGYMHDMYIGGGLGMIF